LTNKEIEAIAKPGLLKGEQGGKDFSDHDCSANFHSLLQVD